MPVFTQYPRAISPLTGDEVLLLAQNQNGAAATCTTTVADIGTQAINFGSVSPAGATTPRPLNAWAGDVTNVAFFGAKLNGEDDSAAMQAARNITSDNGLIDVPPGIWNAPTLDTSTGGRLWRLPGMNYKTGAPLQFIGSDTMESVINGGKWFTRQWAPGHDGPTLRCDWNVTGDGISRGGTMGNVHTYTTVTGAVGREVGGVIHELISSATVPAVPPGADRPNAFHIGLWSLAARPADALDDGLGPRSNLSPFYTEIRDATGKGSDLAGPLVGAERDMYCTGDDPGGIRVLDALQLGSIDGTTPTKARWGSRVVTDSVSQIGSAYSIRGNWYVAAFDATDGTAIADPVTGVVPPALKLSQKQSIEFTGQTGSAHTRRLFYGGDGKLHFRIDATDAFSLDDSGNAWFLGDLQLTSGSGVNFSVNDTANPRRIFWGSDSKLHFRINATDSFAVDGSGNFNTAASYAVAGTQVVGARRTGWTINTTDTVSRASFTVATVDLQTLARVVLALLRDVQTHGLIGT